ncbi:MAG: DNA primase [Anaerolineales bacterium]|nr:DNA primase [Anaerolineales bacterium]MCX7607621.1 DNA primase [Anaerolineales bacterium]MDW8226861.1 DNA primase [Anaerolineales bacterium]
MSQIDEIKSRIDIVDLISETVKLRRSGRNYIGLCPFHAEKTPSFVVSPERQTWHCFGQCNEGGDIFKFLMKKEGWDFSEALEFLAQRAGVQLAAYAPRRQEEKDQNERLRRALEDAALYFCHQLRHTEEGRAALRYLREERHLTDTTIETFGLGYAPRGWDNLLRYMTSRGYREQELIDCGLVSQRAEEAGLRADGTRHLFDRFRERITIPIRDEQGRLCGFGARILRSDDFPKFLNSPETSLFSKSRLLYGLDRARKAIRLAGRAVIVEGYLDVIALHQAGFENVISPMGTALTEEQLRLLKRFTQRIVLALDPDAAGRKAVFSGLEAARQALDRQMESVFDARGLLRHKARLQADLRVAVLPEGVDPDELVQRDPQAWQRLVEEARPIVLHVMYTLAEGRDLTDPMTKVEIASQVLPLIEEISDPVEREEYRQGLARFLRVDERALLSGQPVGVRGRRLPPQSEGTAPSRSAPSPLRVLLTASSHKVEAHCLSILLHRPDLLSRLDRALQENHLQRASAEDFTDTQHQILFQKVRASLEQDRHDPAEYILETLPPALVPTVESILKSGQTLNLTDERLLEDLFRSIILLRRRLLDEHATQLRYLIEEDSLMAETYRHMVAQHLRLRQALDRARFSRNGVK